eukprot:990352-Pyramimonas_sp.AAC.1
MMDLVPNRKAAPPIDTTPDGHPRPRGVVAELRKMAGSTVTTAVQLLIQGIADCAQIPAQFKDGVAA